MIDFQSLAFVGITMQAFGTLFLTVQLWAPVWGLEGVLGLRENTGYWQHLVRDGLLLHVVGSAFNILSMAWTSG